MWAQAVVTQASTAPTVDVNWVVAIGTAAAALGALVGSWVAHRQARHAAQVQQKVDLQAHVAKEVDAKIGSVLISLRTLENDARTHVAEVVQSIEQKQKALAEEAALSERALRQIVDSSAAQAAAIETLLARASQLIPAIQASEAVPAQLLAEAVNAPDQASKTSFLLRILEHPDSDPNILEAAGDSARQELNNRSLAVRLYKRAVEIDPDHVSTRAEYLSLLAYQASEREHAQAEIVALARAHPNEGTVVNGLVNFFIRTNNFKGLLDAALALLEVSREKSLLWRNIAVAYAQLGSSPEDVSRAFETALELADEGDYVNTTSPYVRHLLDRGQLDKAEAILLRAMSYRPANATLHRLKAEIHKRRGEHEKERESLKWFQQLGDPEDKMIATLRLRDSELRERLGLQSDGMNSKVGDDPQV